MNIRIELRTDNAAFYDSDGNPDPGAELARILRRLASRWESNFEPFPGVLHDINGNDVGAWEIQDVDPGRYIPGALTNPDFSSNRAREEARRLLRQAGVGHRSDT